MLASDNGIGHGDNHIAVKLDVLEHRDQPRNRLADAISGHKFQHVLSHAARRWHTALLEPAIVTIMKYRQGHHKRRPGQDAAIFKSFSTRTKAFPGEHSFAEL